MCYFRFSPHNTQEPFAFAEGRCKEIEGRVYTKVVNLQWWLLMYLEGDNFEHRTLLCLSHAVPVMPTGHMSAFKVPHLYGLKPFIYLMTLDCDKALKNFSLVLFQPQMLTLPKMILSGRMLLIKWVKRCETPLVLLLLLLLFSETCIFWNVYHGVVIFLISAYDLRKWRF